MIMATRSLAAAAAVVVVVVMFATCAPRAHAAAATVPVAIVNLTFVNELYDALRVTIAAGAVGSPATALIPAGATGKLPQYVDGPVSSPGIDFQVDKHVYNTQGSPHSRAIGETGEIKFYLTGRCESGPGLQFVTTVAGVPTFLGCALPKKPAKKT